MAVKRVGKYTIKFDNPPVITGYASVVGKKEGDGPLADTFDAINKDTTLGQRSWEKAESFMQQDALNRAISKASMKKDDIACVYGGDLLNQCIGTSFAIRGSDIPFMGLYGACSTMAEGIISAAMAVDGGFADNAAAVTSSHFCTAERQYRFPLEYGGQRTPTAQWTATASGALVLSKAGAGPKVTHACIGRIIDMGITDVNNMGAAMAPAAYETVSSFFYETGFPTNTYDLIVTGDLGNVGKGLFTDLISRDGKDFGARYNDCGAMLFSDKQDVHAGGSGCGCSAAVLCGYILNNMKNGKFKKVLFAGTGALLSPTSMMQGESIPGICHLVAIEA